MKAVPTQSVAHIQVQHMDAMEHTVWIPSLAAVSAAISPITAWFLESKYNQDDIIRIWKYHAAWYVCFYFVPAPTYTFVNSYAQLIWFYNSTIEIEPF